jgi:hypothetical protein
MEDNLAVAVDHSDAPSTTERVGESNIGRTEWRERPQGFEGRAREAPIERDARESIREDITDAIEEVGEVEEPKQSRRERRRAAHAQRVAQEAVEPDQETDRQPTETRSPTRDAPTSWSKEAKAEWQNLSPRLRAEIHKREADMGRGASAVHKENEQIKQNVAQFAEQHQQIYGEIDQAIRPFAQTIQNFGKTPGQAVGQLFAWFDALARNPDEAFPALIRSYKYNPDRMLAKYGYYRVNPQTGRPQQPQQSEIPPSVQQYIGALEQRINSIDQRWSQQEQTNAQQQEAINAENTERMLNQWAEGKEHFAEVRVLMGHLLTPDPNTGQAPIPLKPDGTVDLETAYKWAVRAKIGARAEAQQNYAAKARRKASSITNSAPGRNNDGSRQREQPRGTSVRDSIKDAIRQVSDR